MPRNCWGIGGQVFRKQNIEDMNTCCVRDMANILAGLIQIGKIIHVKNRLKNEKCTGDWEDVVLLN